MGKALLHNNHESRLWWHESRKNEEMNIRLNPKYSAYSKIPVHAGKPLNQIRYGETSTTIPEMGVHSKQNLIFV